MFSKHTCDKSKMHKELPKLNNKQTNSQIRENRQEAGISSSPETEWDISRWREAQHYHVLRKVERKQHEIYYTAVRMDTTKMLATSRIWATTSFIDGRNAEWSNHSEDRLAVPYKAKKIAYSYHIIPYELLYIYSNELCWPRNLCIYTHIQWVFLETFSHKCQNQDVLQSFNW